MIPVFTSKAVLGLRTMINISSGILGAADLAGKRFGIPDYTMTAGLWFRAQLDVLHNIKSGDIQWYVGRQGSDSHARQLGLDEHPPPGVTLHWSDPKAGEHHVAVGRAGRCVPGRGHAHR